MLVKGRMFGAQRTSRIPLTTGREVRRDRDYATSVSCPVLRDRRSETSMGDSVVLVEFVFAGKVGPKGRMGRGWYGYTFRPLVVACAYLENDGACFVLVLDMVGITSSSVLQGPTRHNFSSFATYWYESHPLSRLIQLIPTRLD